MSRRRRQGLSPSLFPFLAVLVCTLGMLIPRESNPEHDREGHRIAAQTLLLLFNADRAAHLFFLPERPMAGVWFRALCSAGSSARLLRGARARVPAHSVSLLAYREPR